MTQAVREEARDRGLRAAIDAAGGVAALARALGISQPSVSGWTRVPADRVAAVAAVTGLPREALRADLYRGVSVDEGIDALQAARAAEYSLLSTLLTRAPSSELLAQLSQLAGGASPLGIAHIRLAEAAQKASAVEVGEEYFKLFIGVGRGELVPYGSFYISGFLNDRPLAVLRNDLSKLGVVRKPGVCEPEDHIGSELELMSKLADGTVPGGVGASDQFFVRHVKPWADRFFVDLADAESAVFYRAVAAVGAVWIDIETAALELAA